MSVSNQNNAPHADDPLLESSPVQKRALLDETTFRQMIAIERKRTERSKAPFVLMLLEADSDEGSKRARATLGIVTKTLIASRQEIRI